MDYLCLSDERPYAVRRFGLVRAVVLLAVAALSVFPVTRARGQESDGGPDGEDLGRAFGPENGVRGTVTAAATDGNVSIRTDEGENYKVFYGPNTHLMKDRQPIAASEIHLGDMVMAGGLVDAKARTVGAIFLVDFDANEVRTARAGFGKTWIAGKVKTVKDLKITIERAGDKQTQVVAVDENTSFRKRKEDVTLADIKVGGFHYCAGNAAG